VPRTAVQRDDIADLDLRRVDDDPIDEQLDELAALGKRGIRQASRDRRSKLLDMAGDLAEMVLLGRRGDELLLFPL